MKPWIEPDENLGRELGEGTFALHELAQFGLRIPASLILPQEHFKTWDPSESLLAFQKIFAQPKKLQILDGADQTCLQEQVWDPALGESFFNALQSHSFAVPSLIFQEKLNPTWSGLITTVDPEAKGEYRLTIMKGSGASDADLLASEESVFSGKEGFYQLERGPNFQITRPRMMDIIKEALAFASIQKHPQEMNFVYHERKHLYWLNTRAREDLAP